MVGMDTEDCAAPSPVFEFWANRSPAEKIDMKKNFLQLLKAFLDILQSLPQSLNGSCEAVFLPLKL